METWKVAAGAAALWWLWRRNQGPGPCITPMGLPCPPAGRVHGQAFCGDPIVGHGRLLRWPDFLRERAGYTPLANAYTGYVSFRTSRGELTEQDSVDFRNGMFSASCERQAQIDAELERLRFVKGGDIPAAIIKASPAATFEFARFRNGGGPALRGFVLQGGKQIATIGMATGGGGSIWGGVTSYVEGKVNELVGYAETAIKDYLTGVIDDAEAQAKEAIDKCAQNPEACF